MERQEEICSVCGKRITEDIRYYTDTDDPLCKDCWDNRD